LIFPRQLLTQNRKWLPATQENIDGAVCWRIIGRAKPDTARFKPDLGAFECIAATACAFGFFPRWEGDCTR